MMAYRRVRCDTLCNDIGDEYDTEHCIVHRNDIVAMKIYW